MYTEFTKKKGFEQLMSAAVSSACCCHGRQKASIPKGDLTGGLEERSTIIVLPVRSNFDASVRVPQHSIEN